MTVYIGCTNLYLIFSFQRVNWVLRVIVCNCNIDCRNGFYGLTFSHVYLAIIIRHVSLFLFFSFRGDQLSCRKISRPPSPWKESELLAGIFYYLIRELRKLISFNLPRTSRPFFLSLSLSPCPAFYFYVLFLRLPMRSAIFHRACNALSHDATPKFIQERTLQKRKTRSFCFVRDFNISTECSILLSSCILYSRMEI